MACKGFLECLLKLLNFLLTLVGLAMMGYGIYLLVVYKSSPNDTLSIAPIGKDDNLVQLGRPMLMAVSLSASIFDKLPKAWFIYLFIGVGVVLFVISCCGCIATCSRNGCCLSCYAVLVSLLILVELLCAAFTYFDSSWEDDIPTDNTGNFDAIYDFLEDHWDIIKWVALGTIMLEALVFFLALAVRAVNRPVKYDSDDEYVVPRQQIRQPLLPPVATGVPVAAPFDQRLSKNDAWSTRMREKYGLDTSEFTYNPSELSRNQQVSEAAEERGCCTIM